MADLRTWLLGLLRVGEKMKLTSEQLVNMSIANAISADNNLDDVDRRENIRVLESIVESGKCNEIQLKCAKAGIVLLKEELNKKS